ncbi:MAG: hypothetical protein WBB22_01210 [Anaerolineae bacterium]
MRTKLLRTLSTSSSTSRVLRTWQQLQILRGPADWVASLAFSPAGAMLASGSEDLTVRLWRVSDWTLLRIVGRGSRAATVTFSPDGATLAQAGGDKVILWDVERGRQLRTVEGGMEYVASVAFSPDGAILAVGNGDGTVLLWDVEQWIVR